MCAVLAVEPCVPRSAALRLSSATNGSVSPVPSRICVYVPPTSRPPWSSEPATVRMALATGSRPYFSARRGMSVGAAATSSALIRFSMAVELPLRVSQRENSSSSCS